MRTTALLPFVVAVVSLYTALSRSSAASTTPVPEILRSTAPLAQSSPTHHLYVADWRAGAIYRYALVRGLPQKSPDEVFARVPNVEFLGVDRSGDIYAASSFPSGVAGFIEEFTPSGTPIGYLPLAFAPQGFAVDLDGYLYVLFRAIRSEAILVYSPAAFRSGGLPQPIATLSDQGSKNDFHALATDRTGRLYATSFYEMDIFDHPRVTGWPSVTIMPPPLQYALFDGALAFDEHGRMYANVDWQVVCPRSGPCYWYDTDFDMISKWRSPPRTDRMIYAGECYTQISSYRAPGGVSGMAVFGEYIDAACWGPDSATVYVYRADKFGHRYDVETLNGTQFPTDAKIGP